MLHILNLIFFIKIKFLRPKKNEILIIDKLTGKRLLLILNKKKVSFLITRLSEINVQIFLIAIINKLSNFSLKLSEHYIISYINSVDPKIIITSNDVIYFFWKLKNYFPDKKVIIFQNNYRNGWDFGNIFLKSKTKKTGLCDLFVTYCNSIVPLYSKRIKSKYLSIGSIENNFFRKKFNNKRKTIVYISQFKNWPDDWSAKGENRRKILLKDSYIKSDKIVLNFLHKFCEKNNKELKIFLRNEEGDLVSKEIKYYEEILNYKIKFINKKNRFQGYKKISNYDFFVTIDSTLGYECLARGKKVAFFNNRYSVSKFKNGNQHYYGWPKNFGKSGLFWTDSIKTEKMQKVLNFLLKSTSPEWSKAKKKYVDGVIDYDYKNKRLIQSLNDIFKKSN
jgi:surface carbohydrate biosynthesis protein